MRESLLHSLILSLNLYDNATLSKSVVFKKNRSNLFKVGKRGYHSSKGVPAPSF